MRTLVSAPARLISIAWVPICSPFRMMANRIVSGGVGAAAVEATTSAPSVAIMTAPNVATILMVTLHAQAVATNTKLCNRPEIWPPFGIHPLPDRLN